MSKELLGTLFGEKLFIENGNKKDLILKWLSDADKAKRELDFIKGMSDLEKRVFYND